MLKIQSCLKKEFKGYSVSPEIIMMFVYMKLRFSLSYRDLEEMMSMRGASIDHSTVQRWILKFAPLIEREVRKRKKPTGKSWRMDETYVKIKGKWFYLYRAVDSEGNTIEFLLRERRDKAAAWPFLEKPSRIMDDLQKLILIKVEVITQPLKAAIKELRRREKLQFVRSNI